MRFGVTLYATWCNFICTRCNRRLTDTHNQIIMVYVTDNQYTKEKGQEMSKDKVVRYDNSLNAISFTGFTAVDLNLFMLICASVKDVGQDTVILSYGDLKKSLGLERQTDKYFHAELKRMSNKLKKIGGSFSTDDEFTEFNLFNEFSGSLKTCRLSVSVNAKYVYLLNNLSGSFTQFELREFIALNSRYSKSLYRILKQFRKTGKYFVDIGTLRALLDCPATYRNREFMRTCLNVAVTELSGYFDGLSVTAIRSHSRGCPITAYQFTFKPVRTDNKNQQTIVNRTKPNKSNRFNNFQQREYDWNEYEKNLLTDS